MSGTGDPMLTNMGEKDVAVAMTENIAEVDHLVVEVVLRDEEEGAGDTGQTRTMVTDDPLLTMAPTHFPHLRRHTLLTQHHLSLLRHRTHNLLHPLRYHLSLRPLQSTIDSNKLVKCSSCSQLLNSLAALVELHNRRRQRHLNRLRDLSIINSLLLLTTLESLPSTRPHRNSYLFKADHRRVTLGFHPACWQRFRHPLQCLDRLHIRKCLDRHHQCPEGTACHHPQVPLQPMDNLNIKTGDHCHFS
ncbi:hypothetical protein BDM02DRAFT_37014 [Thelephora ganbajun]|uniref:Uncharacterized protein n=1 Tax=Thelephora ganbajun TaxID=370292 RepID=A0ACB6ZWH3_THEGA|nr:hypothetical protein BDM02DRAFT_37014 [Thelephora ganbajun]